MKEAAAALGVTGITVSRWCQSGYLPAFPKPYGRKIRFEISIQAVEMLRAAIAAEREAQVKAKIEAKPHPLYLEAWKKAMAQGTLTGKVYSNRTVTDYVYYIDRFFERQGEVSIKALKTELLRIPAHQFATRDKLFKSVLCFGRFLIREGMLDETFIKDIKPLEPKRHLPPKRFTVNEDELQSLIKAAQTPLDRLIVILLSSTGLRASEACSLTLEDIDLEKGTLLVRLGKGNKRRGLGLNAQTVEAIRSYLAARKPSKRTDSLLLNREGLPMNASGLYQRVERLGRQASIKASPHALRRAFVTINANKGRPLVILQRSCGHSRIETTMGYCMTTEQEVIDAMKDW